MKRNGMLEQRRKNVSNKSREFVDKMFVALDDTAPFKKAAQQYASERADYQDDSWWIAYYAYLSGCHCGINGVWHEASEMPTRNDDIVLLNEFGDICSYDNLLYSAYRGECTWMGLVEKYDIRQWCYKKDLLPNKTQ